MSAGRTCRAAAVRRLVERTCRRSRSPKRSFRRVLVITHGPAGVPVQVVPVLAEATACPGLVVTPFLGRRGELTVLAGDDEVRRWEFGWRVTHEPTGRAVTDFVFDRREWAHEFARRLGETGVDFTTPAVGGDELARVRTRATLVELRSGASAGEGVGRVLG